MTKSLTLSWFLLSAQMLLAQGTFEAEKVTADSLIGDGSRITGISNQNLAVSQVGDTLRITNGNFVIIPGLSASNSGNAYANAGADILDACETSFNLQAAQLQQGTMGEWSILSGAGGNLINKTLPQALFIGQEGESYLLQWTVQHSGGSSSFDQLNISIATNTETSVADAGVDLFGITNQTVILTGNAPEPESQGKWEILNGINGIINDMTNPQAQFTGSPGQSYILRWQHFNECSTSSDEITLTFSESAAGVPSANGRYYIPDSRFRQYLQVVYPSAMDGDSLIVTKGGRVKKILINNLNVGNLDGMQFMDSVVTFIGEGAFTSIPNFATTLRRFECQCYNLEIIPSFPASLDTIAGSGWRLSEIPSFPIGLKFLQIHNINQIDELPELPDSCEHVSLFDVGTDTYPRTLNSSLRIPAQAVRNVN